MSQYQGSSDQHFGHISYSQHGEDMMIVNIFNQLGVATPRYLDIGAHHPTHISNTKLLYERGSLGVNVEANPNLMAAFEEERPLDINVQCGVGLKRDVQRFYMFAEKSGRNTFCLEEARRYEAESGRLIAKTVDITVKTINQIVDEYCAGYWPHFLNCDAEGMDYDILESARFDNNAPIVICVEVRAKDSQNMTLMMQKKAFYPHCRMGENIIYVKRFYCERLLKAVGLEWP